MRKTRTMKLYLDNTFDEKGRKFEANKIQDGKDNTIEFEPICSFTERKPRRAFYRGTRKLILFVDGATHALRFTRETAELQTAWTKKEAVATVKKAVAKSAEEVKPLRMWQFVLILVIQIMMFLALLNHMGVLRIGR